MRDFEPDPLMGPVSDWSGIAGLVTARVRSALAKNEQARGAAATYLRELEAVARREQAAPAVLQVISSARRLLGEQSEVQVAEAPFLQRLG